MSKSYDAWVEYDDFMDLETGYMYKSDFDLVNGSKYVSCTDGEILSFPTALDLKEETMKKGKILEKYREYRKS